MYSEIDFEIHVGELEELSHSQYLNPDIKTIVTKLLTATGKLLTINSGYESLKKPLVQDLAYFNRYLRGSTMNEIPYEIEYCMRTAINDWISPNEKCIIAIEQSERNGFYIDSFTWKRIREKLSIFLNGESLDENLILVEIPRIYNQVPIFYTGLYHEIGHYVDDYHSISFNSINQLNDQDNKRKILLHRKEYFADIFAASYAGYTIIETLRNTNPQSEESESYPATDKRIQNIIKFLENKKFPMLNEFHSVLKRINRENTQKKYTFLPKLELKVKHKKPDVKNSFNDLRPAEISSTKELHGILVAGWDYLQEIDLIHIPPWAQGRSKLEMAKTVNDLITKSIRNFSVTEKWNQLLVAKDNTRSIKSNENDGNRHIEVGGKKVWIQPFLDNELGKGLTVDLRLGYDFLVSIVTRRPYLSIDSIVNGEWPIASFFQLTRRDFGEKFVLYPNQIVLTTTLEYIGLPDNCFANVYTRNSYAKLGISFDVLIEPGYRGCVSVQLLNHGNTPIEIVVGARMFQMKLSELDSDLKYHSTNRKYAGLVRPIPSLVSEDEDLKLLLSQELKN